jgi:aerobic carbon-monoxide dehydrogenase medium subunit
MIPHSFECYSPTALQEVLSIPQKSGENTKILACEQGLIPVTKLRLGSSFPLIDINQVLGLNNARETNSVLLIGAMSRIADLECSDLHRLKYGIIQDASAHVADPQVLKGELLVALEK